MAVMNKFLFALFLFCLASRGKCQCYLQNLTVSDSRTGNTYKGKAEWKVTLSNNCPCTQLDVNLDCAKFHTTKPVDPSILSQSGGICLFNNGQPIASFSQLSFTYAWDTPFPFTPISSQIACS